MQQFIGKKAKAGSYQFFNIFVVTNCRVHGTTVLCPVIALCFVFMQKEKFSEKSIKINAVCLSKFSFWF